MLESVKFNNFLQKSYLIHYCFDVDILYTLIYVFK
jgi:hypothetical protein